jgi:hypothetical protein
MTHLDSSLANEGLEELGEGSHDPVEKKVVSRRSALRFGIATALGVTGLINVGLSVYRKRNIEKPQASWEYVQRVRGEYQRDIGSPMPGLSRSILSFEEELAVSGLSYRDVTSDAEYQETVEECLGEIIDAIEASKGGYTLEDLTREFATVLRHTLLEKGRVGALKGRLHAAIRRTFPVASEEYLRDNSTHEVLSLAKVLHYGGISLDAAHPDCAEFRENARSFAERALLLERTDPTRAYCTVELCALLDETMGLDLKSSIPAGQLRELAKIELKEKKEEMRFIFVPHFMPPVGYVDETFLTSNAVATYAGIESDDPDYRAAIEMAEIQMTSVGIKGSLRRRLRKGEGY